MTDSALSQLSSASTLNSGNSVYVVQSGSDRRADVSLFSIFGGTGGSGAAFSAGVSTGGNTSGNTGTVSNQLVLAGGNNITLSESTGAGGATVTISAAAAAGDGVNIVSASGNTSGTLTSFSSGTVVLAGGNNITLSQSSNTITISGANQSNQTDGIYASQNTTGNSTSLTHDARSLTIEGLGGVSVGWSTNNSHLLISGPQTVAQTNQTDGIYASQNTTGNSTSLTHDARSLTIEGLGAVSVGWSTNNSHLLISAPNTIAQSNQTDGIYASQNTTGNSTSLTHDARSLTIEGLGAVSVGWSTNNSHLLISAPNTIAQSNQTEGIYASGNTTGNSSSLTFDARSLTIEGDGIISVGWSTNNSHLLISASQSNQTEQWFVTGNTEGTSSSTFNDTSLLIRGSGIASVGWNNGSFVIDVPAGGGAGFTAGVSSMGNTAGTTGTVNNQLILVGGSNVTLSQSTNGASGTVTFNAPNERSLFINGIPNLLTNTTYLPEQSNTIASFAPFRIEYPVAFSQILFPIWFSITTGANTSSRGVQFSITAGIYTRSNSSITSYITQSTSLSTFVQSNSVSSIQGNRYLSMTVPATTLTPGEYWMGLYISTVTTGQVSANNTVIVRPIHQFVGSLQTGAGSTASQYGSGGTNESNEQNPIILPFGTGEGSSYGYQWFLGRGTITHGGSVSSKALTDISVSGSNYPVIEPAFQLRNWSLF